MVSVDCSPLRGNSRDSIIEIFDVKCEKTCTWCEYCDVEQNFGGYQSCTLCFCHTVKLQSISSHHDKDTVVFRLVWYDLCNNAAICDRFEIGDFTSGNEEDDMVPLWYARSYPPGHPAYVIGE